SRLWKSLGATTLSLHDGEPGGVDGQVDQPQCGPAVLEPVDGGLAAVGGAVVDDHCNDVGDHSAAGSHRCATTVDRRRRRFSVSPDFKGELVLADTDVVTIGQIRAGADALTLHLDTVGRPQIGDNEAGSGVDDDGVVAAHIVIGENDVVVRT